MLRTHNLHHTLESCQHPNLLGHTQAFHGEGGEGGVSKQACSSSHPKRETDSLSQQLGLPLLFSKLWNWTDSLFYHTMEVLFNRLGFMDLVVECKKSSVRFEITTFRTPASSKCLIILTHQVCLDSRHDLCVDVSDSAGTLTFDRPRIESQERALITTQPHCYISYICINIYLPV